MTKRSRKQLSGVWLMVPFAVLVFGLLGSMGNALSTSDVNRVASDFLQYWLPMIFFGICTLVLAYLFYEHVNKQARAHNVAALQAHKVDEMTGKEFELFLEHLLIARGYKVRNVYHQNDGGVDLVAKKDEDAFSIQAKRFKHRNNVDRRAITDAVAGMAYRDCTKAMVITNSRFTKAAKEYAEKTKCILIDRDKLGQWVAELGD